MACGNEKKKLPEKCEVCGTKEDVSEIPVAGGLMLVCKDCFNKHFIYKGGGKGLAK